MAWFKGIGLFRTETVELTSPLPPAECARRLRQDLDSPWKLFGKNPLIGRVSEKSLRARLRISYRNSFQTILTATFAETASGTRIACRFALDRVVRAVCLIWLAALAGVWAAIMVLSRNSLATGPTPPIQTAFWVAVLLPTFMTLLFFGIFRICRYLARHERDDLLLHLKLSVAAHPG